MVLGFFGRPAAVTPREAGRDLGRAGLYAIPALAVAWLAAIWVAMTLVAFYTGRMGPLAGAAVGWLAAGTILAVAGVQVFRALQNAYARWPERRAGTLLAAGKEERLIGGVLHVLEEPAIAARFGLLEAHADPALPITIRNLDPQVGGREVRATRARPGAWRPPLSAGVCSMRSTARCTAGSASWPTTWWPGSTPALPLG